MSEHSLGDTISALNDALLLQFPQQSARQLEAMAPDVAADILSRQPLETLLTLWRHLLTSLAHQIVQHMSDQQVKALLTALEPRYSVMTLRPLPSDVRQRMLNLLHRSTCTELTALLDYPEDSAGGVMNSCVITVYEQLSVRQAVAQLKQQNLRGVRYVYVVDHDRQVKGRIEIHQLLWTEADAQIEDYLMPIKISISPFDRQQDLIKLFEKHHALELPVVDVHHQLIGVVEIQRLLEVVKEEFATEVQTMVGASKDERALSPTIFAVKKRLSWLQINLLTAFFAAAVIWFFEDTIARFTALAILLPIVAGQSGNSGSQALAVTMRGLALREISLSHWLRVALKELRAGFINGLIVALTAAGIVYLWSWNFGLSIIIALAMVISMVAAGVAGALVPIGLKRFGLDPAQSSSIILTTITDIVGLFSFLGIATLLHFLLV